MFPYVIDHGIEGLKFTVNNAEAKAWYDPLKPYTKLEYEWVRENLDLNCAVVVDAGCHHGNYSIVFKPAYVIAVDCVKECCTYAAGNMVLNEMFYEIHHETLGETGFETKWEPDFYKIDIEGAEFQLLPGEIDRHPSVYVWIIEIHPRKGDPQRIARDFESRGFELLKVDREKMIVRPYVIGEAWPTHATLIARKPC